MPPSSNKPSRRWVWIVLIVLLAAGLLYYALPSSRERLVVRSARATRQDLTKTVATNGKVEPLADFQAHAPMASTVERLNVHLGQQIARGQEILKLDASDAQSRLAEAQSAVQTSRLDLSNMRSGGSHDELLTEQSNQANAKSELQQATTSLQSLKALQGRGAASANEVAAAQDRVTADQAKVNQLETRMHARYGAGDLSAAQSQVARAQGQLAAAQSNLAGLDIHSPIAGTVYFLPIARYDYVQPGEDLVNIADLDQLQVRAYFDEPDIGSLAVGQPVKIVWDAKPDRVWHGHVTQAPTTIITFGTRNVGECLISVDDANGDLLPNTNVTVTVTTLQHFGVLSLPREALNTQGSQNFVYRIVDDKLVRTPVSVGVLNLTRVEITGGLHPGDLVALGATTDTELQDGLRVRTQP